jgi:mRNA interferase RelE/StbE
MKTISYQPAVLKTLRKIPANTAKRIVAKINEYAINPAAQANSVKALKGTDAIRLRVGHWRVVMIDGLVIDVIKIAARGDVDK